MSDTLDSEIAAATGPEAAQATVMEESLFDRRMLEALVCPETHTTLRYDAEQQELISEAAGLAFPIRNGIPIMLIDEARPLAQDA